MKHSGWRGMAVAMAVALAGATMPATPARAESGDSSAGASITIGLMAAVVVVYALVSLRSDVERYTQADVEKAIVTASKKIEESPVVFQAVSAPLALSSGGGAAAEVAGAAIGWRVCF